MGMWLARRPTLGFLDADVNYDQTGTTKRATSQSTVNFVLKDTLRKYGINAVREDNAGKWQGRRTMHANLDQIGITTGGTL